MLLRSLENKLSCCGVARANTTLVQLGNLTYERTNDFAKGDLGTKDLDGALRFTVVIAGVRPSARMRFCYILKSVSVVSRDKNDKTNQCCDGLLQECDGHDPL